VLWTNCEAATEIARQLQLRNIGGMVIVDFIDMESRRDQLLLLEHFMKAMAPDKARPQIAQITELGLVELTRKRQGRNVYELFGHQCPGCSGQGHVARVPGKATMQPLVKGMVQAPMAPAAAPGDTSSDVGNGGNSNNRRRRRGGGRNGTQTPVETPTFPSAVSGEPETDPSPEAESTPPGEPEIVAVPMSKDQETVFSWCGFNPALMASTPPKDLSNVAVRVICSDEDTQSPSVEAREQVANGSPGHRRRQRNRIETDKPPVVLEVATDQQPDEQSQVQVQEENAAPARQRKSRTRSQKPGPLPVTADQESSTTTSPETPTATREGPGPRASDQDAVGEQPALQPLQGNGRGQNTSAPHADGAAAGEKTEEEQDDDRQQPRRRRRRSST